MMKITWMEKFYFPESRTKLIKYFRKKLGFTQKEFSALFDPPIPINTIKKWDSGQKNPPAWVEGLIIEKLLSIQKDRESK